MSLLLLFRPRADGVGPEPEPETPEVVTGGGVPLKSDWARVFNREQRALERRWKREKEKRELEDEIERLEAHLVETGTLKKEDATFKVQRISRLVRDYRSEAEANLTNRARRAFDYAERVKSEAAYRLALREYQRLLEEEEAAVLMLLLLDD